MMRYIALFLVLLNCLAANAQKKETPVKPYSADELPEAKKEAAYHFKGENYRSARTFYERLVVSDPNDVDYNYRLAMCYLNTNINKAKAIPLLEYVVNSNSKDIPKDAMFEL